MRFSVYFYTQARLSTRILFTFSIVQYALGLLVTLYSWTMDLISEIWTFFFFGGLLLNFIILTTVGGLGFSDTYFLLGQWIFVTRFHIHLWSDRGSYHLLCRCSTLFSNERSTIPKTGIFKSPIISDLPPLGGMVHFYPSKQDNQGG
jgi:hypothetical protein